MCQYVCQQLSLTYEVQYRYDITNDKLYISPPLLDILICNKISKYEFASQAPAIVCHSRRKSYSDEFWMVEHDLSMGMETCFVC